MNDFYLGAWFIEVNNENREIINNWKINQPFNKDLFQNRQFNFVCNSGSGYISKDVLTSKTEITTKQFKKYVLGIEIDTKNEIITEDLDYLKDFLTKLNIK